MAAPPSVSIDDLTGRFIMNHTISDPFEPLLVLQGLSWFLRKAITLATITLSIHQYTDPASPHPETIHIDITQTATGGISKTQENRVLDWSERDHQDGIFGKVKGRSRMVEGLERFKMEGPGPEVDRLFLLGEVDYKGEKEEGGETGKGKGWLEESGGRHVHTWVRNVDGGSVGGWTAEQVWGFEEIQGKRFHTRRVVVRRDVDGGEGKVERARLVYDYKGER